MNSVIEYFKTSIFDSFSIILEMAWIIFLVMLLLEVLKAFKILEKINNFTFKVTKYLGISPTANFALLVGVIIGISYGAGAIIASHKNGDMSKKDVLLVSVFLCICHAIIEDTFLYIRIGANGYIIVIVRVIAAIVATCITNVIYTRKEKKCAL